MSIPITKEDTTKLVPDSTKDTQNIVKSEPVLETNLSDLFPKSTEPLKEKEKEKEEEKEKVKEKKKIDGSDNDTPLNDSLGDKVLVKDRKPRIIYSDVYKNKNDFVAPRYYSKTMKDREFYDFQRTFSFGAETKVPDKFVGICYVYKDSTRFYVINNLVSVPIFIDHGHICCNLGEKYILMPLGAVVGMDAMCGIVLGNQMDAAFKVVACNLFNVPISVMNGLECGFFLTKTKLDDANILVCKQSKFTQYFIIGSMVETNGTFKYNVTPYVPIVCSKGLLLSKIISNRYQWIPLSIYEDFRASIRMWSGGKKKE